MLIESVDREHKNNKNLQLLQYLQGDKPSPSEFWALFADWAVHYDDGDGEIVAILERISGSAIAAEDYDDEVNGVLGLNPEIYYEVPKNLREEFEQDNEDDLREIAESSNTRQSFRLQSDKLVHLELIHFTNDAESIAEDGFRYGVPYITHLGETVRLGGGAKSTTGYNFAYAFDRNAPGNYGIQLGAWKRQSYVIFKGEGVRVYHFGDREEQIIFWGGYVSPSDILRVGDIDDLTDESAQ